MCPWCYIGKRRLEAALERLPQRDRVEIVRRMRDMQAHVEQVAAGEGLAYRLADNLSGNTLLAHELVHLAAEPWEAGRARGAAPARVLRRGAAGVRRGGAGAGAAGAQPAESLLQLLERAWADTRAA